MSPILHEISSRFSRPLTTPCVLPPAAGGPGCTVVDRWRGATCGATARRLVVDRNMTNPPANLMTAIDCTAAHP